MHQVFLLSITQPGRGLKNLFKVQGLLVGHHDYNFIGVPLLNAVFHLGEVAGGVQRGPIGFLKQ